VIIVRRGDVRRTGAFLELSKITGRGAVREARRQCAQAAVPMLK